MQFSTPTHFDQSTILHADNTFQLKTAPGMRETLYWNLSPLPFTDPFYFGYFGAHQYILIFRTEGIRFSHSPSGGGPPSNPEAAWDWQCILPTYEVLQEYGYRARVAYREH